MWAGLQQQASSRHRPFSIALGDAAARPHKNSTLSARRVRARSGALSREQSDRLLRDAVTGFRTQPFEFDYQVRDDMVVGKIPGDLRGTYFRNGPGLQVADRRYQRHHLDGDGCVFSLAFPGGGRMPRFVNKYVRTEGFVAEQAAGKPLYRNAFTRGAADGSSTAFFNPFDLSFKNVANTGVLFWAGRLWALWEAGRPYALDPRTLTTLGEDTMGGRIGPRLAAHYRVVINEAQRNADPPAEQTRSPPGRTCVCFSTLVTLHGTEMEFYEFDEDGRLSMHSRQALHGFDVMPIHDMVVTPHWYVVLLGPVRFDVWKLLTEYAASKCSLAELLRFDPRSPGRMLLFSRPPRSFEDDARTPRDLPPPVIVRCPPFFSFHHVNAYEREEDGRAQHETVVLDTVGWEDLDIAVTQHNVSQDYFRGGCRSHLYRLVVDVTSETTRVCERMLRRTVEFPQVNPAINGRPYRYAYFAADAVDDDVDWAPAQALLKVTLPLDERTDRCVHRRRGVVHAGSEVPRTEQQRDEVKTTALSPSKGGGVRTAEWRPGDRCFVQEPVFVPKRQPFPKLEHQEEDDGWIIVAVHNAATLKGEIAVLDARRVEDGPVALIKLPHALPYGLHGAWTDAYLGPDPGDTAVPAWRPPHRIRQL